MNQTITAAQIVDMLRSMAGKIRTEEPLLTKLDSVTGDGDHGTAMLRSAEAIEKEIDANPDAALDDLFTKIAWAIMSNAGGSTGPLLGSLFMGFSEGAGDAKQFDGAALADLLLAGIHKMHAQSKANVGDRTMMDALLPAAEALQANREAAPAQLLAKAADAADAGAEATKDMRAKFGRARNLGDRVLGHIDPGAKSMAVTFAAFAEAIG